MLAEELAVPFRIIDIRLDEESLRDRVQSREQAAKDASEADLEVLKHQLANREDLDLAEQVRTVTIDGGSPPPPEELLRRLEAL